MTLKPDSLRTPGEKTPQGLKDSSKQGHKIKDFLLYGPLLGVNTYVLIGTNTQLNQRIFYINIYIVFFFFFI